MIQPTYIVAFTGHRSSNAPGRSPAELEACRTLIEEAFQTLQQQIKPQNGILHMVSSVAEGADTIALEVAQKLGITTHIILPMPEESFKDDFSDRPDTWQKSSDLIKAANSGEKQSTLSIAASTHQRPDCYADANEQMLTSADILIALWNGEDSKYTGGSAQFWRTAEAKKIARIHINPISKEVDDFDLDQISLKNDPSYPVFKMLAPHFPRSCPVDSTCIDEYQNAFEKEASDASKSARTALQRTIWLHGSASILAAVGVSYALSDGPAKYTLLFIISIVEFILIFIAEKIHHQQHKTHRAQHWITFRFATELLRPLKYISQHLNPLRPLIQHHHPSWRRFMVSIVLEQQSKHPEVNQNLETTKLNYINNRVVDQITYFKKEQKKAEPRALKIYKLMRACSKGALITVFIAILYKATQKDWFIDFFTAEDKLYHLNETISFFLKFLLYLLPIILPLLAGTLLAHRLAFDISRRNLRYQHMIDYLTQAKENIAQSHTYYTFSTHVAEIEDTLLDELKEFDISQRIGLEH